MNVGSMPLKGTLLSAVVRLSLLFYAPNIFDDIRRVFVL
jgi:hypothetical protein